MSRVGMAAIASARVICLLIACAGLSLLILSATATAGSTVKGEVYDWATFDIMDNAVVEVYSMPGHAFIERRVVKTGSYSLDLPAGTYMLYAKAGTPGTSTELLAAENITIAENSNYTIDLILFPPSDLEYLEALNATVPEQVVPTPTPAPHGQPIDLLYPAIGLVLVTAVVFIGGVFLYRKRTRKMPVRETNATQSATPFNMGKEVSYDPVDQEQAPEQPADAMAPKQAQPVQTPPPSYDPMLPQDCRDVIAILEKNGGRMTQLDLRKQLPYSEAKVSLIVSDMESRGIVKKVKKGRGNILILNRPDRPAPEK
ncbi:helix-turn-helix transcriptional regulator [Methanocella arvoryzae]|nr:hypothetical protein [Methanocella arvoryzae]